MIIKDWFLYEKFNEQERYAVSVSDTKVLKETEKALYVEFSSEFGFFKTWIPKSCIMTDVEIETIVRKENENIVKYEKLVEWAKSQGLNVRKRMKKSTVLNIINNAKLTVPVELN